MDHGSWIMESWMEYDMYRYVPYRCEVMKYVNMYDRVYHSKKGKSCNGGKRVPIQGLEPWYPA